MIRILFLYIHIKYRIKTTIQGKRETTLMVEVEDNFSLYTVNVKSMVDKSNKSVNSHRMLY